MMIKGFFLSLAFAQPQYFSYLMVSGRPSSQVFKALIIAFATTLSWTAFVVLHAFVVPHATTTEIMDSSATAVETFDLDAT